MPLQALDPSDWRLPEMRAYWYSAFALTMLAVAYSLVAPYLLSDGVLGLWIWPILVRTYLDVPSVQTLCMRGMFVQVPAVMFHASTVGYVLRRPELCVLSQVFLPPPEVIVGFAVLNGPRIAREK